MRPNTQCSVILLRNMVNTIAADLAPPNLHNRWRASERVRARARLFSISELPLSRTPVRYQSSRPELGNSAFRGYLINNVI